MFGRIELRITLKYAIIEKGDDMKKIYIACAALILILAFLYGMRLMSMGFGIKHGIVFFAVFVLTAAAGIFIVKLFSRKIRKNMEDN